MTPPNPFEMRVPLKKDEILCIGCFKPTSKAFALTGRIIKGINFIQKPVEEIVWNPKTGKVETEMVLKTIPIHSYTRGFICQACGSDYRTVPVKHRDGTESWKPVVKLDPSATQSTTLNPGESKIGTVVSPDDGFGYELCLRKEDIDPACYSYFYGKKGRSHQGPAKSTKTATVRNSVKSESQLNAEASK